MTIRHIAFALALLMTTGLHVLVSAAGVRQGNQSRGLKIVVIEGEDAVNIIQQKTAVNPVVEVRDENDLPVAGAVVRFTISGGKNATFAGGAQTLSVTTNAAGRAVAAGLNPLGGGAVQVNVTAAFQGQTAAATIAQTNVMTAAEAASAGASGGGGSSSAGSQGGGGVSKVLIASLAGAAGAGAYVGLNRLKEEYAIRIIGLRASRSSVLLGTGSISFSFEGIEEDNVGDAGQTDLTYFWEYGDGTTATHTTFGPQPQPGGVHEYLAAGTFTVTLTVTGLEGKTASAQTTVTVWSMTGNWRTATFTSTVGAVEDTWTLTQTGTSITGSAPPLSGPSGTLPAGSITGLTRAGAPALTFTITRPGATFTYSAGEAGFAPTSANVITGAISGGGFGSQQVTITRQ